MKIQQFADDTTLFLRDREDLNRAIQIFEEVALISGLQMSHIKTEAMWLGQNRRRSYNCHNLNWVKQTKILGIHFRNEKPAGEIEDNWAPKLENIKRVINQWSRRNFSIFGKIIIAKMFLISQLIYIMQSIGLPEKVLNNIN